MIRHLSNSESLEEIVELQLFEYDNESSILQRYALLIEKINPDYIYDYQFILPLSDSKNDSNYNSLQVQQLKINIQKELEYQVNYYEKYDFKTVTVIDLFSTFVPYEIKDEKEEQKAFEDVCNQVMEKFKFTNSLESIYLYICIQPYTLQIKPLDKKYLNNPFIQSNREDLETDLIDDPQKDIIDRYLNNPLYTDDPFTSNYINSILKQDQYEGFKKFYQSYKKKFREAKQEIIDTFMYYHTISRLKNNMNELHNSFCTDIKETAYSYESQFEMNIDIYELFDILETNTNLQMINVGKFYKLYNNADIEKDLIDDIIEDESYLRFFFKVDGMNDFLQINIIQQNYINNLYICNLEIIIKKSLNLSEQYIFDCLTTVLPKTITNIQLKKIFYSGVFLMKVDNFNRYIFTEYSLNDSIFSNSVMVNESGKLLKEKGSSIIFFLSSNKSITNYLKISLDPRVIDNPKNEELVLFSNYNLKLNDTVLFFNIKRTQNLQKTSVNKLIKLFSRLMYYMYDTESVFIEYYKQFFKEKDLQQLNKQEIIIKERKDLKYLVPDLFIEDYTRKCGKPPTILLTEEDEKKYKDKDIMTYPLNEPNNRYVCEDAEYKYPGLKLNPLSNKDKYPYLPCCYKKDQNVKGSKRYSYEHEEEIEGKGFKQFIISNKILQVGQYATLPTKVTEFLSILDTDFLIGNKRYIRCGVPISYKSCIDAICIAIYGHTNNSLSILSELIQNCDKNISAQNAIETKQIKYMLENKNKDTYIDILKILRLVEEIIETNILVFSRDKVQNIDGKLEVQPYYKNFLINKLNGRYQDTILLFKTNGSERDIVNFPHYEVIGCETTIDTNTTVNKNNIDTIFGETYDFLIDEIYTAMYSMMKTEKIKFDIKYHKIYKQIPDAFGKIRIIHLMHENKPICLITTPITPLGLDKFLNQELNNVEDIFYSSVKYAIDYFINEDIEEKEINSVFYMGKLLGIKTIKSNVEMFIPTNSEYINKEKYKPILLDHFELITPIVFSNKDSLLGQYNHYTRLSNYILSYVLYMFSILYTSRLFESDKISDREERIKAFEDILEEYKDYIIVTENHNYSNLNRNLSRDEKNIIKNRKFIIVPNEQVKQKLLYVLRLKCRLNSNEILLYKDRKYVPNYYINNKDFKTGEHFLVYNNKQDIVTYRQSIIQSYDNYMYVPLTTQKSDTFYFSNPEIGDGTLFIAQRCKNIGEALYISNFWRKYKINRKDNPEILNENYSSYVMVISKGNMININTEFITDENNIDKIMLDLSLEDRNKQPIERWFALLSLE